MSHLLGVNGLKRDFFALFGNNMIYHGITVIFNDTCRVDRWFSTQNIHMKIMFQTPTMTEKVGRKRGLIFTFCQSKPTRLH